jgi:hypothetical protein
MIFRQPLIGYTPNTVNAASELGEVLPHVTRMQMPSDFRGKTLTGLHKTSRELGDGSLSSILGSASINALPH